MGSIITILAACALPHYRRASDLSWLGAQWTVEISRNPSSL